MARRRSKQPAIVSETPPVSEPIAVGFWTRPKVVLAVVLLLALHASLEVNSLLGENATVDEVAHLPAGVTYWERGTFKLYHHNPPLVKLVAALPVVLAKPNTAELYQNVAWSGESQADFGQLFALANYQSYFELFDRARLMMPIFSVLGGLVVFAWSSRLYGVGGGLLSLTLWCLCPNILANGRLVTGDVAASAIGAGATYLFWRYQKAPTWTRAGFAGLALGLAQLTKFSQILLFGLWPLLAVVRFVLERQWAGWPRRLAVGVGQGGVILALSVVVIDAGYLFEGVGTPLGRFEFASRSLTRPVSPGMARPRSPNPLLEGAWRYRVNRFRGTLLGQLPSPLPAHYLLGFDEQKIETEGVPKHFLDSREPVDDEVTTGYAVYLDGQLRRSGWWYFYLATLAYKVPEGTWVLVALSGFALVASKRARAHWADEIAVLAVPIGVLGAMSFLTDICIGLRYILPIFPYVFVATGKVIPWAEGLSGRVGKRLAWGLVGLSLATNSVAVATIHPHYLAYFNWISGGPDRGSEHLIDSNLDWGQDLVGLDRWLRANHPGRPVGLAYFGQINPSLLSLRGGGFEWFLPPALPGKIAPISGFDPATRVGPARTLKPGLYAVSASIVRGLPWRFFDSVSQTPPGVIPRFGWRPSWNSDSGAFAYFGELTPVARVGHSIYVYEVTPEQSARLARRWGDFEK